MPNQAHMPVIARSKDIDSAMRGDRWDAPKELLAQQRWRMNNLYSIVDVHGQVIDFQMNWAQLDYFNRMHYNGIILKARQLGFSTFIELLILDMALWRKNFQATIIAHGKEEASKLFSSKILFAYNQLPDAIRAWRPAVKASATGIEFSNGSKITVTVSARSGTNQFLHISEFGKICQKYPAKADEIVTGSLETVHSGSLTAIESTAEGHAGHFYDMCQRAQNLMYQARKLTNQDYRFFFYPWHREPKYEASEQDQKYTVIPQRLVEYYHKLDVDFGVELTQGQKVWYAKKEEVLGPLMYREHPSYAEEAFFAKIEGAYYGEQIARMRMESRICSVPINPNVPVDTWWDLGWDDYMVIILTQTIGGEIHFVDWYMDHGYGLEHYAKYLKELAVERNFFFGDHIAPNDIGVHELGTGKTRAETALQFGLKFKRTPQRDVMDGINLVRGLFPTFWVDEEHCGELFDTLATYHKEWDPNLGAYKDKPKHDESSHAADALRYGVTMHPFATRVKVRNRAVPEAESFHPNKVRQANRTRVARRSVSAMGRTR